VLGFLLPDPACLGLSLARKIACGIGLLWLANMLGGLVGSCSYFAPLVVGWLILLGNSALPCPISQAPRLGLFGRRRVGRWSVGYGAVKVSNTFQLPAAWAAGSGLVLGGWNIGSGCLSYPLAIAAIYIVPG